MRGEKEEEEGKEEEIIGRITAKRLSGLRLTSAHAVSFIKSFEN